MRALIKSFDRLLSWVSESQVAKLLVSVRSAIEAQAAVAGGAAIIDVKEPLKGPLGRAAMRVCREVASVAKARRLTVSVAVGELNEWFLPGAPDFGRWAADLGEYIKLGLSHVQPGWRQQWRTLRDQVSGSRMGSSSPAWVAVVYADWQKARAPQPGEVVDEALVARTCHGVLIDTWDKESPSPLDESWKELIDRVKERRFIALAGRIDIETIERLAPLEPDIIAVRGAACAGGDRLGCVDADRVARLAEAVARLPERDIGLIDARASRRMRRIGS